MWLAEHCLPTYLYQTVHRKRQKDTVLWWSSHFFMYMNACEFFNQEKIKFPSLMTWKMRTRSWRQSGQRKLIIVSISFSSKALTFNSTKILKLLVLGIASSEVYIWESSKRFPITSRCHSWRNASERKEMRLYQRFAQHLEPCQVRWR